MTAGWGQRDTQRGRLYQAQQQVQQIFDRSAEFPIVQIAGSSLAVPPERKFGDIASVQGYVDALLALNWLRTRWPAAKTPIAVRERRGQAQAHYERSPPTIALPPVQGRAAWAMRELVVLHEVSHHLAPAEEAAHGPTFAGLLVELLGELIGPEAGLLMQVALADHGIAVRRK